MFLLVLEKMGSEIRNFTHQPSQGRGGVCTYCLKIHIKPFFIPNMFLFAFPPEGVFHTTRGIGACPVTTDCIVTMS